jgi:hypothetical protein
MQRAIQENLWATSEAEAVGRVLEGDDDRQSGPIHDGLGARWQARGIRFVSF